MTEEKRNRIVVAVTVNIIILIAILAAVAVYQIVQITRVTHQKEVMEAQIKDYIERKDKIEDNLEYSQSHEGLEDLAYQYGFVYGK